MKRGDPQTFIVMGRSGSGKGTQATLLLDYLKRHDSRRRRLYIETGDRFRALASKAGTTSSLVAESLAEGGLLPDFLAIWNWSEALVKQLRGNEHLVIDGAPRSRLEAEVLDTAFRFYRRRPVTVILIDVSEAWARERLLARGREDDRDRHDVEARLRWFESEVRPALNFFKREEYYRFIRIDGEQPIEAVHEAIIGEL